ncbi:MAG: multidrug efflux pump [Flavobacteriales bacterium]|jgi:multidrug efflux pump
MTDIFIKRPVLSIIVSVIILVAGIKAYSDLSIRKFPKSDSAVISVQTIYIGANAELVRGFITQPIERVIASVEGVNYIESQSAQGLSTINVFLELNYDPVRAVSEINSKINQVRSNLPPEAESPTLTVTSPDSQFAIAYFGFNSDILSPSQITDYLARNVQPRISVISGIQRADLLGAKPFAMRIWLNPNKMAAFNISATEIQQALASNNIQATLGQTKGALSQMTLSADTDLNSVADFEKLIVRRSDAGTVRLNDLAKVELGSENYSSEVSFSGESAVFMGIWVVPTANALEVISAARAELESIKKSLPVGLNANVAYDSTAYIDESIKEVSTTLIETLIIITIIIFLFLGFSRSIIIPILAIPLSLIGAVFIIYAFGFSLNLVTLLAIVLSVGLVVDDAIIMVENIERHIEAGHSPFQASIIAARELVSPIFSMTITLIAVYVPIALQGGLTGTLFREFAVTLAGAITISAVIALTLSPMLGAKMLSSKKGMRAPLESTFEKFRDIYTKFLESSLERRNVTYFSWAAISLLIIPMYMFSPKELAPLEDQGIIINIIEGPSDATLDHMVFYSDQVNDVMQTQDETSNTFQVSFPAGGFSGLITKPWSERERSVFEILPDVRAEGSKVAGLKIISLVPPALPGGSNFPVEFIIASTAPTEDIYGYAQQLQQKAAASGKFAFPPIIDLRYDQPSAKLKIDKEKVASYGLSLSAVTRDLAILLGDNFVNRFSMDGLSYRVIPQVERASRLTPEELENLYVNGPNGQLIRLAEIAHTEFTTEPRTLNRFQQLNAVKLSAVPTVSLDEALSYLDDAANTVLPSDYIVEYSGDSRQLKAEGNLFIQAITFSIVIIFIVLAIQFNSFRDPLIILLGSVPLAMFGALIFTYLKNSSGGEFWTDDYTTTLNIYSQVGLVTLVGLIVRNGILVVEFANQLQKNGLEKIQAIKEASIVRLRPVLMTSIATIAGHTPLIFAYGAGAEARNSIGLVLVLGMFIGTIFTLIVLPSIYILFAKEFNHEHEEQMAQAIIDAGK